MKPNAPMKNESDSINSARKKCAREFAAWLTGLPELAEWEERKNLAHDLTNVYLNLCQQAKATETAPPSLLKIGPKTRGEMSVWIEETMNILNLNPPEDWNDQNPDVTKFEKVVEIVNLLKDTVMPYDRTLA